MEDASPIPKIKFFVAIKKAILNIKDYKGRSRRSEYFYWLLTVVFFSIIVGVIALFTGVPGILLNDAEFRLFCLLLYYR